MSMEYTESKQPSQWPDDAEQIAEIERLLGSGWVGSGADFKKDARYYFELRKEGKEPRTFALLAVPDPLVRGGTEGPRKPPFDEDENEEKA